MASLLSAGERFESHTPKRIPLARLRGLLHSFRARNGSFVCGFAFPRRPGSGCAVSPPWKVRIREMISFSLRCSWDPLTLAARPWQEDPDEHRRTEACVVGRGPAGLD